jgi:hypothetical protein
MRIKLKYLIEAMLSQKMGPYFTQDPKDGYPRPKLNRTDHSKVQTYIVYTLGRYKKDYLKMGTELTTSRLYSLIKKSHREKKENVELNIAKIERWFNGHDIIQDQIPLMYDFKSKKITVVKLEDGMEMEKERQSKESKESTGEAGV